MQGCVATLVQRLRALDWHEGGNRVALARRGPGAVRALRAELVALGPDVLLLKAPRCCRRLPDLRDGQIT